MVFISRSFHNVCLLLLQFERKSVTNRLHRSEFMCHVARGEMKEKEKNGDNDHWFKATECAPEIEQERDRLVQI